MVVVSITLPARLLKRFDEFTKSRGYFSRSEAFRDAVRSLISEGPVVEMGTERLLRQSWLYLNTRERMS